MSGGSQQQTVTQLAAIPIQTSVSTVPIPIVYGQARISPNLIWYGAFSSAQTSSGKGGGGKGGQGYVYSASVALGLCEGPLPNINQVWLNKKLTTMYLTGLSFFNGSYSQNPWAYLTTNFPGQDLNYRGLCYVAQANMALDSTANVPNFKFEAVGNFQLGGGATFIGSIAFNSNVLNVTSVIGGSLSVGQVVSDTTHQSGLIVNPTSVLSQLSGPTGGAGTYHLSNYQTNTATENMMLVGTGYRNIVFNGSIAAGSNVLTVNYMISGTILCGVRVPAGHNHNVPVYTTIYGTLTDSINSFGYIIPGTAIIPGGTGTGGVGTYLLSAIQLQTLTEQFTSSVVDCDPKDVLTDFLTNANYGVPSFLASYVGNWAQFSNYCRAQGLLISASLSKQESALSFVNRVMEITNSDVYWSDGVLKITPRGDTAVTGNGVTFTPNLTPVFNLTDDNYVVKGTEEPVKMDVSDPVDAYNDVTIQWTNRANQYNQQPLEISDLNAINQYGLRKESMQTFAEIHDPTCAQISGQLRLQRLLNFRNQYKFTLPVTFCMLEPTDLVTLTDSSLGMNNQLVRILSVDEDEMGNLSMVAEEMNIGTGNPSLFSHQAQGGYAANYNQVPPSTNPPILIAPPIEISLSTLELWLCASGNSGWGGCDVWVSSDNATYKNIGRIIGGMRAGVLSAALASGSDPDIVNTISVDLSESLGQLDTGSQQDADLAHTMCYVDGEIISYETATLTSQYNYNLTSYLRRGQYGSPISSHAAGTDFVRLDGTQFNVNYTADQIGTYIYFKLPSFNIYQGALQDLSSIPAIPYYIPAPPLPENVTGFGVTQSGSVVVFSWNQVADYALKGYDIGFAPQGTVLWSGFEMLTEAAKGTEMTNAAVPPGTWVFGIRARDVADQLSPSITTVNRVITDANLNVIYDVEEIGWGGSMVGLVEHYTGVLVPKSQNLSSFYVAISPPASPVLSPLSGGGGPAETYFAKITYTTGVNNGETLPSPEASLATSSNTLLKIAAPTSPPANATGWNAYVSLSTGTETLQNATPIALNVGWTEPTTGLIAGSALPTTNTTGWETFTEWVPDPVTYIQYTTNTMDASYDENLRIYDTTNFILGIGQSGTPAMQSSIDTWLTGTPVAAGSFVVGNWYMITTVGTTDFTLIGATRNAVGILFQATGAGSGTGYATPASNTFTPWTIGFMLMRYIQGRISANITQGNLFMISDYTLVVDLAPIIENSGSLTIAPGGTVWIFPKPFHTNPLVQATAIGASAAYATASNITPLQCTIHIWNSSGTDVGGSATVTATGE